MFYMIETNARNLEICYAKGIQVEHIPSSPCFRVWLTEGQVADLQACGVNSTPVARTTHNY